MTTQTEPETKPTLLPYVDSSMLTTFKSCKVKFHYNYMRHLQPPGKSVHLVAGAAFAAGMEAARKAFYIEQIHDPALISAKALQAFATSWGDYSPPDKATKTFANTFEALDQYLQQNPFATNPIQPYRGDDGVPAIEYSFAVPLPNRHPDTKDPILFVGRFDMLGVDGDLPIIVDEKTTSALGQTWVDQWSLRGQMLGYCWALQQHGIKCNTACIQGIAILKRESKFLTALTQYPQHLVDRWYHDTLSTIEDMIRYYKMDYYPHNFGDACSSYGGCLYKIVCESKTPEAWYSNYEVQPWDPLAK